MISALLIFIPALALLLFSAHYFTYAAEQIGGFLRLPQFVIGVFIVGIGTSLPELIAGVIAVNKGVSEILPGNIMGSSISNILLITGIAVVLNKKNITLNSNYIYIDLHFLLGSFMFFYIIAYDGVIDFAEACIGMLIYVIYSFYLIKGGAVEVGGITKNTAAFPYKAAGILVLTAVGIYFGAEYTVASLEKIALHLQVPSSVVALTLLSLGTTLPELAVNVSAIRKGKAEMALGNVLGSCIFNALVIPAIASGIGTIQVPDNLLHFSLPVMASCGLLFYLLTQDKKISIWEGLMFVCLYVLFIIKVAAAA
ncbi:MAG TPA: sodium:calcium antiporter [Ferruginibacter sp.]|nr:sodium:calcium antiporter [Ferruginibacter sp.]HMP21927.1 sodium:calcium antiporter [Ferruginibacter sp.]